MILVRQLQEPQALPERLVLQVLQPARGHSARPASAEQALRQARHAQQEHVAQREQLASRQPALAEF